MEFFEIRQAFLCCINTPIYCFQDELVTNKPFFKITFPSKVFSFKTSLVYASKAINFDLLHCITILQCNLKISAFSGSHLIAVP